MALIGKIRNNSWLLIVLIGLGLGGFLLMDMTSGGGSPFGGGGQNTLGSIEGKDIPAKEFFQTEDVLYSGGSGDVYNRRTSLWNYFVEKHIVEDEAEALGLSLTNEEFNELQFGNNLSPIISSSFSNPQTRQVDREQLNQIKQAIETNQIQNPNFVGYWRELQKQVKKDALQTKLNALVAKGMYSPSWMVEKFGNDQNQKVDFAYVRVPFSTIDNSAVTVSDADYSTYLNNNVGTYSKDEETRQIGYVTFDIKATAQDSTDIYTSLQDEIAALRAVPNDSIGFHVTNRAGIVEDAYFTKDKLGTIVANELFDASLGTVYGPYKEGNDYKVAKLIDRMVIPDSVESRHILIKYPDPSVRFVASQKADSILNVLQAGGASFADLATQHSEDEGSKNKNGELGYAANGRMVQPFNDLIFYKAKKGEYNVVESSFGFHIVEVTGQKFINRDEGARIAYLRQPIIPSAKTQKEMYKTVGKFINENNSGEALRAAADADPNLDYNASLPVAKNDFLIGTLGSGQSTRDMIKFAFKGSTSTGDVSPDVHTFRDNIENYDNKYVVATLESVIPEGMPSVANIKSQIETPVINAAKAKQLISQISGTDLNSIAAQFESSVDTVKAAAFTSSFLQGLGNEPKVVAAAFNMENGTVSKPIEGTNGVYILKMINKQTSTAPTNLSTMRAQVSRPYQSQVVGQLMESMKKGKDIEDNRSLYY